MATYKQFEAYIRKNFKVLPNKDAPKGFMVMGFNLPNGRSHVIFIAPSGSSDELGDVATLLAPIGKLNAKQIDAALTMCFDMPYGLVKADAAVFVKTALILENIDENEIEIPIRSIIISADILEEKILGVDRF
jgi:hypothetical protein